MLTVKRQRSGVGIAAVVEALYQQEQSDYYLEPIVLVDCMGSPIGRIQDGDVVVFCCRRGEREVQLTEAFTDLVFEHFERAALHRLHFVTLTRYHEKFSSVPAAFAPSQIEVTLGECVSRANLSQLRIAESEKFAHVTYFFNGGRSQPFERQVDINIPSPKGIPFEEVPELNLPQVVQTILDGIRTGCDLIVTNFANGDVIGHTTSTPAKIACAAAVDVWLGRTLSHALEAGYTCLVTADHGNLEVMVTPDGKPHVSHSANIVPLILVQPGNKERMVIRDGSLANVAPTILSLLGLQVPAVMTGASLVPENSWGSAGKILLIILDGWGLSEDSADNPIFVAETPVWDALLSSQPVARLQAAGKAVGLQEGKPGNSEAGHISIAAGRVVPQDDLRLNKAMQDGSFFTNPVLLEAIALAKERRTNLHLIGLLTEKSSHGSMVYPLAVAQMAKDHGLGQVFLHMIFDGRSTEPGSAPQLLARLENQLDEIGVGIIATGIGRGYALDRDRDYEKTRRAYDALVDGRGCQAANQEISHG